MTMHDLHDWNMDVVLDFAAWEFSARSYLRTFLMRVYDKKPREHKHCMTRLIDNHCKLRHV